VESAAAAEAAARAWKRDGHGRLKSLAAGAAADDSSGTPER
jgi:hypothetical protein